MSSTNVQPILCPDRAQIVAHLEHLFGDFRDGEFKDGLIELSWTSATPVRQKDGAVRYSFHAEHFRLDRFDELTDKAVRLNSTPGVNVYVGAWLRHPTAPPFGRADDKDAWALSALYTDLDDDGAAIRGKHIYQDAKPTWITVTGSHPWLRGQLWWKLDRPITDHAAGRAALLSAAQAMGGDETVCNPGRIMRLCGTVAWPHKDGRVMELTHQSPLRRPGKPVYALAELQSVFPPISSSSERDAPKPNGHAPTSDLGNLGKLSDGRERYMRDTVLACLIEFIGENGCAPTAQELFDAVWPQYSQHVDFRRPGRGAEEVLAKCDTAVRRFANGSIRGLETLGAAVQAYSLKRDKQEPYPDSEWDAEEWPIPIDIWDQFKIIDLPRGVLPKIIEDFAFSSAEIFGADPAGFAMAAIAVCAAALPDRVQVQVKQHSDQWMESARLWVALNGPPSTKKSPIISEAAHPLFKIDHELRHVWARKAKDYHSLPKEEKKDATPPPKDFLIVRDTTVEKAQDILADSHDGVICVQDELSGFFGSMDRYSDRGGNADRAFWLQAYNGGYYTVDRVSRGSFVIPNLSISLLGVIQPEPLQKVLDGIVDDGLIQRLLIINLKPASEGKDIPQSPARKAYHDLVIRLRNPHLIGNGGEQHTVIHFSPEAQEMRRKYEREHVKLIGLFGKKLSAHFGKYDGLYARLCLIFHCIEKINGRRIDDISKDTADRVGIFLHGFLMQHAFAFYEETIGISDTFSKENDICSYILAHKVSSISYRDIKQQVKSVRKLTRKEVETVMDYLDAMGWVNRAPKLRVNSLGWLVNPKVHQIFAERTLREVERRAERRNTLIKNTNDRVIS